MEEKAFLGGNTLSKMVIETPFQGLRGKGQLSVWHGHGLTLPHSLQKLIIRGGL